MQNSHFERQPFYHTGRFALALVLVVLLFYFSRVLFTDSTYYFSDCHAYLHPMKAFMVESFKRGEFPLWDPYPGGGYPFHGSYVPGVVSPFHLLYLLLPFEWSFKYVIVLSHIFAAITMFLFLGAWRLHPLARATGAIAFALSSYMISATDFFVTSMPWVPLVLFFYHRALVHLSYSNAALAGVTTALAFCHGDLQTTFGLVFLLPVYAAVLRKGIRIDIPRRRYFRFMWRSYVLAGGIALILSSIQLLPSVPTLFESTRGSGLSLGEATSRALPLYRVREFVHYGRYSELYETNLLRLQDIDEPFIRRIFLGLTTIFLLGFALRKLSKRSLFIASGLAFTFILALGNAGGVFTLFWYAMPGFRIFRYPEKWLGFFTFFFAAGAALGLDRFKRNEAEKLHTWAGWAPLPVVAVIIFLFLWLSPPITTPFTPTSAGMLDINNYGQLYALAFTLVFVALAALTTLSMIRARSLILILTVICILELVAVQYRAESFDLISMRTYTGIQPVGRELFMSDPDARLLRQPAESYIENKTYENKRLGAGFSKSRVITEMWRRTYRGNVGAEYGVPTVHGITSFQRPQEKKYWQTATGMRQLQRAVNCYSAKYVLASAYDPFLIGNPAFRPVENYDNELVIRRNMGALPRAYCVASSKLEIEDGDAALLLFDNGFDPVTQVILSTENQDLKLDGEGPARKAKLVKHEPRYVEIALGESAKPEFLVLTDSYAAGWTAKVDGADAPIQRANMLFRAVLVPPGAKKVEFFYDPWTFYLGLAISLLGLAAIVPGYLLLRKNDLRRLERRHRKNSGHSHDGKNNRRSPHGEPARDPE